MMQAAEAARVLRDIGRTAYAVKPDLAAAGSGDVRWPAAAALLDAQLLVGDHAIGHLRLVPAQAHALCGDRADRRLHRQQQPPLHGLVGIHGHAAGAVTEATDNYGAPAAPTTTAVRWCWRQSGKTCAHT